MSLADLTRISDLLLSSRKKATSAGDYISAISDHEQVIKMIGRTLLDCPANYVKRLEILKTKVQRELKILNEISRELITFPSKGYVSSNDSDESTKGNAPIDKDVFRQSIEEEDSRKYSPPPKFSPGPKNNNLPSWAAGRESEIRRLCHPAVPAITGVGGVVSRKAPIPVVAVKKPAAVAEDPVKIDRMRRERDSNGPPRRAYVNVKAITYYEVK